MVIENCEEVIDEAVEITFEIPQNSLLALNKFPHFNNDEMGYLLNDCDMSIFFEIGSTAEYVNYAEFERNRSNTYTPRNYGLSGYVLNYSDNFIDEWNDVFAIQFPLMMIS